MESGDNGGFVIFVFTGDKPYAGTDAAISIQLYDAGGHQSDVISLDNYFSNDFERGQKDTFCIDKDKTKTLGANGKVDYITVWKKDGWIGGDWFVDKIVVENRKSKASYVFPVFRWIRSSRQIKIAHLDTSLPQNDRFEEQRKQELVEKKKIYVYKQRYAGGPVKVKEVPEDEKFSFNIQAGQAFDAIKYEALSQIVLLKTGDTWETIEDVSSLFVDDHFERPDSVNNWNEDIHFGFQRVGGIFNHLITLVKTIPEKFPVNDEMVAPLLEGSTLSQLIEQKRLFICDLEMLEGIRSFENRGVELCVPIALFFVDKNGKLRPVAIQLYQEPKADNPIFTPLDDPNLWTLVKMWYNNAEGTLHQSFAHLGMTHMIMEGIDVSMNRNMSLSHPIFKLLSPHFLYLIAINGPGVDDLLSIGGPIDTVFSSGTPLFYEVIAKAIKKWRLDVDGTLPEIMKENGVGEPGVLPEYPYRDDGMLLYNAIKRYVSAYVKLYYPTSHALMNDYEIQNWVEDIVKSREDGGVGMLGVPGNGKLTNTDDLITICACVIYTCSVRHAAVNFGQYDIYSYPLNYPSWMSNKPPTSKTEKVTEKRIVSSLTEKKTQLVGLLVTQILSTKATKSLGDFEVNYIFDPPAVEILNEFKKELLEIGKEIRKRNKTRTEPYEYLLPKDIPNSISI